MPKYARLKFVKASLPLDPDAEMVAPTQTRKCKVCAARKRSGTMILYRNRDIRPEEELYRSTWKCETCSFAYPGPWDDEKGPTTLKLVRGRIAYEQRLAAQRWTVSRFLKKIVFGRTFAAGRS